MISYLKGILQEVNPISLTLDVQGVGYEVMIPSSLFPSLPSIGEPLCLHTSLIIREFSHTLYGFLERKEKEAFEILLEAKGVGPKLALSLMSHLPLDKMVKAMQTEDFLALSKVPGVGKKTAERLFLDLRDKLMVFSPKTPSNVSKQMISHSHDAISALQRLGYSLSIAQEAVYLTTKELPKEAPLDILITSALKKCK